MLGEVVKDSGVCGGFNAARNQQRARAAQCDSVNGFLALRIAGAKFFAKFPGGIQVDFNQIEEPSRALTKASSDQ